ncbi:MAG: hypothetical protein PSV46_17735 [Reyranella sp.]|nr:hypothetical protein [Reyranella sp.]
MKTDLASTLPPLAGHPPPLGKPEALKTAPTDAADKLVHVDLQDLNLVRDLSLFARVLRRAPGGRRVMAIFVDSIVVTVGNMVGQVWPLSIRAPADFGSAADAFRAAMESQFARVA